MVLPLLGLLRLLGLLGLLGMAYSDVLIRVREHARQQRDSAGKSPVRSCSNSKDEDRRSLCSTPLHLHLHSHTNSMDARLNREEHIKSLSSSHRVRKQTW